MTNAQERKAQERQARRRRIQEAARTVFTERGYAGASIELIARAAQLSVGAIYLYFRSKEDLYVSLIEDTLTLFDVERLPTHGGSLRIYARHIEDDSKPVNARALELLALEQRFGLTTLDPYAAFAEQVRETKRSLLEFLIGAKRAGKRIVGYGAPGKGNTLLNYCGIGTDFLDFTVDRNPYKQGKYTPGTHIPILHPDELIKARPDYVLILPWNLKGEILATISKIASLKDARFIVPIPRVEVVG